MSAPKTPDNGIFGLGLPMISEQAPGIWCDARQAPLSSYSDVPIGTRVVSCSGSVGIHAVQVSVNPVTRKPIYSTPISAGMHCGRVSTTSKQSGSNPSPIPPVGIISPKVNYSSVDSPSVAPSGSRWGGVALFAGAILLLWFLAGASIRRFV